MKETVTPWEDWVPGVLSAEQVKELVRMGGLKNLADEHIDLSAIDLVIDAPAYKLVKGAIKPFGGDYSHFLNSSSQAKVLDFEGEMTLRKRNTYAFKIRLEVGPRLIESKRFHGRATGRSSVGRVDVLTRLMANGMDQYESFSPDGLHKGHDGKLFLEVTPLTFDVVVKPGIALSQLRLFLGSPESALMRAADIGPTALRNAESGNDGYLSLQVEPEEYSPKHHAVAFRAITKRGIKLPPVKLWKTPATSEAPDPAKYWDAVSAEDFEFEGRKFVTISHGSFYILRSKESLSLPAGVAVYCRPSDETIGEMRIHYAGFVHPWFGRERLDSVPGTPLIFEVRGHDFDVSLMHGEKLARLDFYRMSKDAVRPRKPSDYFQQSLKLSGFFGKWSGSSE